jgi:hypothetical protein
VANAARATAASRLKKRILLAGLRMIQRIYHFKQRVPGLDSVEREQDGMNEI